MQGILRIQGWFLAVFLALFAVPASAMTLNMTEGVTIMSHEIYHLHMLIFYICCAIGVIVFGVLIYSLINHRRSKGAVAAAFHENTKLEIAWAIVPFLILIVMAVPATRVLIAMHDTERSALTIKVTGYQWRWQYEYMDKGVSFFSNLKTSEDEIANKVEKSEWYLLDVDEPLVIPVNQKVRFLVTANDVIHAWWVPALGVKRDAMPGYIHEAWAIVNTPGIYRGQCAELCGMHHGFMPIVVKALPKIEFDAWMKNKQEQQAKLKAAANMRLSKEELLEKGKKAYEITCAACHKPEGVGMPPAFPALKGSKITTGPLANHLDRVLNGVKGTAMQAFGAQLDDVTIAAIVTYERNAWDNDKANTKYPTIVQPADVIAARQQHQ